MMSNTSMRPLLVAAFAAAFVVGCRDPQSALTLPVDRAPSFDLSDGANKGNPHFYFLPPMVPAPRYTGMFDAALSPVVEICRGTATPCAAADVVARYTKTTGPGSETIRVDAASQLYIVNWNTDQFTLSSTITYRLRVLVEKTVLGYADVKLYSTGGAAKNATTGTDIELVNGRTLPIKFRIETGAVYVVQPPAVGQTATIATTDGAVTMSVPSGAITEPVAITADPISPASNVQSAEVVAGTVYEFGPQGSQFAEPLTVTVKYDAAKVPGNRAEESLRLATLVNGRWEWVKGSRVDPATNTVTGELEHFSTYAVMPARRIAITVNLQSPSEDSPSASEYRRNEIHLIYETGEYLGRIATFAADPAWSHDGSRIAFIEDDRERLDAIGVYHLQVIAPDGTGRIALPGHTRGELDAGTRLIWTPDDQRIIYTAGYLCFTSTDPSGAASCTGVQWQGFPGLSPDGKTIAFDQVGSVPLIGGKYLANVDGSGAHEILHFSGGYDWWGNTWSSDGTAIFFTTNASLANGPQDIRRLDVASGAVTTLVSGIEASYENGDWGWPTQAMRWLTPGTVPGRSQLTFFASVNGAWGYWTIDEDGSGLRLVYSDEQLRTALGPGKSPVLINHESWEP